MATRSRIGLELSDGSVLSVYHHWDSYESWLGRILKTHYNSKELAAELIDGGDMSCAWTDDRWDNSGDGSYGPNHYAYRGEDCPPRLDATLTDYLLHENNEEFAYLFTRYNKWVCYNMHQFDDSKLPEVVEIPSGALAV